MSLASTTKAGTSQISGRSAWALVGHQIRYEQLSFWRNPQSAFFTFVFPVVIIVIFGAIFSGGSGDGFFFGLTGMQYYTATIAAVGVLGACYAQLAIVVSIRRQLGILKRVHATPLPAWIYFVGLVAHCVMVGVLEVSLIIVVGRLYGVPLPGQWGALAVTIALGAASFCALGVGVSSLIRNAEAAPTVVQFIQFPLVFLSGSYLPIHSAVVNEIAGLLPVKPFNDAMLALFAQQAGIQWKQLGILAAWGVAGALVAVRRFRWDSRPE